MSREPDIVERLRAWNKASYPHNWEAAAEIERLRLRVKFLEDELKCPKP